jgi:hypothetical protein
MPWEVARQAVDLAFRRAGGADSVGITFPDTDPNAITLGSLDAKSRGGAASLALPALGGAAAVGAAAVWILRQMRTAADDQ